MLDNFVLFSSAKSFSRTWANILDDEAMEYEIKDREEEATHFYSGRVIKLMIVATQ